MTAALPQPLRTSQVVARALAAAAALAVPSAVFLEWYRRTFDFGSGVVLAGLLIVLALGSTVALLALAAAVPPGRHRTRRAAWILALASWCLLAGLAFIYAGAALSNAVWGDTVNLRTVLVFARYPDAALSFLPVAAAERGRVLLALGGGLVLAGAGSAAAIWVVSRRISAALATWLTVPRGAGLALGLMAAAAAAGAGAAAVVRSPESVRGEPVMSFFGWLTSSQLASLDTTRLAAAVADSHSLATYPPDPPFDRKSVVLIVADALRADRMGVYGYERPTTPFLSSLLTAGTLHRVDMALSSCSESYCGIATMLAARPFHEVSAHNHTLHKLFKQLGYQVEFFLAGDHRGWNYLQDFYGDAPVVHDYQTLDSRALTDDRAVLDALDRLAPYSGTPVLLYAFLMSSHMVGDKLPEYERWVPAELNVATLLPFWNELAGTTRIDGKVSALSPLDGDLRTRISNRYDNGVLQADAMVKRVMDTLEAKGYLANALVVVVGDHGDGLGEHGHIGHTRYLYQEDIRVPLLVYDREPEHYRNAEFATHIDIAPTILSRLGLPIPGGWTGRSLTEPAEPRVTVHQTRRGTHPCAAAVEHRGDALMKYLRCGGGADGVREELYDLAADPYERRNLAASAPDALARLRGELDRRFAVVVNRCEQFECVD